MVSAGFEAWFVGGYVRDAIMDRPANDVDIATSAHWQQVRERCQQAGFATYETGVKHGTLTVVPDGEHPVEVTTFRADGQYKDNRHPESVTFVSSIQEDLARRDFTVNAIAYSPDAGLLDPFHGMDDIANEVIRFVGCADERCKEDALRILRGCRFASQLGFMIEPDTLRAMYVNKHLLGNVSQERKTHELDLLLMGAHPHDVIMECADVLAYVLPELVAMKGLEQRTKYHCYDVLEHTAWAVELAEPTRLVRWAALCHDMGKPASMIVTPEGVGHFYGHAKVSADMARAIASRMLMSQRFADELALIIRLHSDVLLANDKAVRKRLAKLGGDVDLFRAYVELKRADAAAHAEEYRQGAQEMDAVLEVLDEVLSSQGAYQVSMLAVSGRDVIAAGVPQGPEVGRILSALLEEVIEGRLENTKEALLARIRGL